MAKKGLFAEVAGWLGDWAIPRTYRRSDESVRRAVAYAVEQYAGWSGAARRGLDLVATVRGIPVLFGVGNTYAWFEARTQLGRGARVRRTHVWRGPAYQEIGAAPDDGDALPGFDAAWNEITRQGAGVALVGSAERTRAWVTTPAFDDLVRVAAAVAAHAVWDVVLARALAALPEGALIDGGDVCPAAKLAPDGLVIGFRGDTTVILLGGREHVRDALDPDPARLRAEVAAVRRAERGGSGPYR